ncbi:acyltransferase [Curtobacterium albidum]|uniref:acyltransferase family protein n=1 Tax=Curtobacterium citreum TaxID=2036 RepID=UPI002026D4A5|nr:acyltransferase [Curtobacterium albidum]MCL9664415.1 acyltransferase [Curtobacterium albidum]
MTTLQQVFDPRRNALNAIRLALALVVVVSHTWPIGGYGREPHIGDQTLGNWAVAGFFAISGYLITGSRLHSRGFVDYIWRRVLRIYPAFLVVLLVVAFGFAPAVAAATGDGPWTLTSALLYVLKNLALDIRQYGILDTLNSVPFPRTWNGSLWTLFYEFLCYLAVGVSASVLPRKALSWCAAVALLAGGIFTFAITSNILTAPSNLELFVRLLAFFAGGMLLYLLADRTPLNVWFALGAFLVLTVASMLGVSRPVAGLPVAYLMLYLGCKLPLHRIGSRNDISYGVYIYAFPVQQVLAYVFVDRVIGPLSFALLSAVATIPFAWASWLLVEKPAMSLKHLTARRVPRSTEPDVRS